MCNYLLVQYWIFFEASTKIGGLTSLNVLLIDINLLSITLYLYYSHFQGIGKNIIMLIGLLVKLVKEKIVKLLKKRLNFFGEKRTLWIL
jgi:hypothetical protein